MLGALIGDIAGSRFERRNIKSKDFELLLKGKCHPTDDSVMSLAVAKAILDCEGDYSKLEERAVFRMREMGKKYPSAGYGGKFLRWISRPDPEPYNSLGNGAGMRVSPCAFAAKSMEEALFLSDAVTRVTHNHPEGMKGARAVAAAVYLAKTGSGKEEIREHIRENYYRIDFTLDEIRPSYKFDVTCQGSIPQALEAFFEAEDFEDAIRNAISIGGDSDTIAAMAGGVAGAFYGIPDAVREKALTFLDKTQLSILMEFEERFGRQDG